MKMLIWLMTSPKILQSRMDVAPKHLAWGKICLIPHGVSVGGNCGIQHTLSSLTIRLRNRNNYPNPNVCKQDLNSSLAAVC